MPYNQMGRYRGRGVARMRGSRPVVHSIKNQQEQSVSYIGGGAVNDHVIVQAVKGPDDTKVLGTEVPVGALVKSLFIHVSFVNDTAAAGSTWQVCLIKLRDSQTIANTIVNPTWTNIGLSDARNQIIWSAMGVTGTEDATALNINRQIRIPQMLHRTRAGDAWHLVFTCSEAGILRTGTRYKYYS